MAIWDAPAHEVLRRIPRDEYRFLASEKPAVYLAILVELYRARQQHLQFEVPFDTLLEAISGVYEDYDPEQVSEAARLRQDLHMLERHGNVQQRIEPRRIRRIQDRGLDRVLVRLTDSTAALLGQLEARYEQYEQARDGSARFSLIEVDDALSELLQRLDDAETMDHDSACRAGRSLARARRAVGEAGDELLRLDLWLSALAVDVPDHERLQDLIQRLEVYFDRYLREVEQRRQACFEKIERLTGPDAEPLRRQIDAAMARELADDPTRGGVRPRPAVENLATAREFLEPSGILDERRHVVHERLADVAGHLKRHLAELVRRSQLLERLRHLSTALMHVDDAAFADGRAERLMTDLWQSAHVILDETPGTPSERTPPPRPHRLAGSRRTRPSGAVFTPRRRQGQRDARALMLERLSELNTFVDRAVLRGRTTGRVSEAELSDAADARLLIAAVRLGRQRRSALRQRYLGYVVSREPDGGQVELATADGTGRLSLPELMFAKEA